MSNKDNIIDFLFKRAKKKKGEHLKPLYSDYENKTGPVVDPSFFCGKAKRAYLCKNRGIGMTESSKTTESFNTANDLAIASYEHLKKSGGIKKLVESENMSEVFDLYLLRLQKLIIDEVQEEIRDV